MKRSILVGSMLSSVVLVGASLVVSACSKDDKAAPSFTIGIKFDQPGMSEMGQDGTPHGFDVDTATYIAKNLGADVHHIKWQEAKSSQREQMLNSGTVDFVVASYSISSERQKQVAFAGPYLIAGQDLLVRAQETAIDGPNKLNGKTVCTAEGSTSADKILKDFAAGLKLATRATYSACVDDLISGKVDAVTTDDVILAGYAAAHPTQLKLVGHRFTRERYGVGVKKSNTQLQERITAAIQAMIGDGSWQRAVTANISAPGYRPQSPPPVFSAPASTANAPGTTSLDPSLVQAVHEGITKANAQDWNGLGGLACPEEAPAISAFVAQYNPMQDPNVGPDAGMVRYTNTVTGITQADQNSGSFLAHTAALNVPEKYSQYFRDIDYTGTMVRRDGAWKICALTADFIEP